MDKTEKDTIKYIYWIQHHYECRILRASTPDSNVNLRERKTTTKIGFDM